MEIRESWDRIKVRILCNMHSLPLNWRIISKKAECPCWPCCPDIRTSLTRTPLVIWLHSIYSWPSSRCGIYPSLRCYQIWVQLSSNVGITYWDVGPALHLSLPAAYSEEGKIHPDLCRLLTYMKYWLMMAQCWTDIRDANPALHQHLVSIINCIMYMLCAYCGGYNIT